MYGALVAATDRRPQRSVFPAPTYSFSDWFVFGTDRPKEELPGYQEQMLSMLDPSRFISQVAPAKLYFQFGHGDYKVPERAAQLPTHATSEPEEVKWYDARFERS
jgi:hypothetical protein